MAGGVANADTVAHTVVTVVVVEVGLPEGPERAFAVSAVDGGKGGQEFASRPPLVLTVAELRTQRIVVDDWRNGR